MRFVFLVLVFGMVVIGGCSVSETRDEGLETSEDIDDGDVKVVEVEKKKIIAFGDSLTEGLYLDKVDAYPAQLERMLEANGYDGYEVVNAGVSGETTSGALSRVDWILKQEPEIVILETGANDAFRGTDLELTRSNIKEIIKKFQEADVVVILAGMEIVENLGEDYVNEFESIYPQVAQEMGVPLVERFLGGVAGVEELNFEDGIHANEEGYAIVAKNVYDVLVKELEK